jgi:MSHA pilin protein MshA
MKRSNQGFTLIELIIVIVILGILAVTASPKFLDLTSDARISTVDGIRGNVSGAANVVYSKAIIDGFTSTDDSSQSVSIGGQNVLLVNGYPDAQTLDLALDLGDGQWQVVEGDTIVRFYPDGVIAHVRTTGDDFGNPSGQTAVDCYAQYTESTAEGVAPAVAVSTGGC